ncbi:acyltransferase family protein [Thermocatellispora tengchongensis]|uniref:acyltransferase family protein n=1 Tax=Thermocatellispora tengchongensis TaxID=1073253 RepID=UPI0036413643
MPGQWNGTLGAMTPAQSTEEAAPASVRRPHLPALDGLRGVAIIGVLLFHTGHLPGGFLGVDLFFALSGYLITDLLLREVRVTGAVSLAAFWGRRVRRLLPALAGMLASVTVLVWAVGPPDLVRTTLSDGPWVQSNLVNWHLLVESAGYWDRFGSERVFEHLWSIAVEEQFYLVWPALLAIIAWWARRAQRVGRVDHWGAVVATLVSAGSLVLMIVLLDPADPSRVYTGTDTRAFSLLLGALVATRPVHAAPARAIDRRAGAVSAVSVASAVSVVGIGAVWLLADGTDSPWLFTGGLFAHSLAAALLIGLCAGAARDGRPGPGVAAAAVVRADLLQPVPVALARDRAAVPAAVGPRRMVVDGDGGRRVDRPGRAVEVPDRGSDPVPRPMGQGAERAVGVRRGHDRPRRAVGGAARTGPGHDRRHEAGLIT